MIETKKSFCRFCHVFCGIEVDVEDNKVVAVRGDRNNAVTQGYTCMKGRAEVERIHHPQRLLSSKKQHDGQWEDIAFEQALDEIAEKLRPIVDKYGPRSVAVYAGCGAHRTSSGGIWLISKFLKALRSPSFYSCFTIDSPAIHIARHRLFGGGCPLTLLDIDHADVTLFAGVTPTTSHLQMIPQSNPTKRLNDALKRGMKLIVIDPRRTPSAKRADIHLQVKPGEDATLLAGMIKIMIEQKLYDKEFVEAHVSGLDELYEAVRDFDLDYVSRRTQVPAALISRAAEMFATAKRGGAQSGTGVHMARHQNLSTQLVWVLNALCGRFDKRGGIVRNESPAGYSIPEGMGPIATPLHTKFTSRIRGIRGTKSLIAFCPEMPASCLTDEILTPGEDQVRALIVIGGNPALVMPDETSTIQALKKLDLLVVSDLFKTATARYADYVLAVKHPFERADVPRLMNESYPFPFTQYTDKLVEPPKGVADDWEVIWGLAKRLGLDLNLPGLMMDDNPTTDDLIDSLHPSIAKMSMDEIRKYPEGRVWGERELKVGNVIPNMIAHPDGRLAAGHPEVIAELREVRSEPIIDGGGYELQENFAFRLITYRMKEHYCTQTQNLPSLKKKRPYNPLLMHPEAMESLAVQDGDCVTVDSGFGKVSAIVETTDSVTPGTVALAFGWGDPGDDRPVREKGSNVQRLIPDDVRYDPVTGLALQSAIPVNVFPE
jgi:anaerobic selenocysteine-containing dehydrogenase